MRIVLITVSIVLSSFCFTQELSINEVRQKMSDFSNRNSQVGLQLRYEKLIFENYTDSKPIQQSKGKVTVGKGKEYKLEEDGLFIVQNNDQVMTVDSINKVIYFDNTKENFELVSLKQYQNDSVVNAHRFYLRHEANYDVISIEAKKIDEGKIELYIDKNQYIYKFIFIMPSGNYVQEDINDQTQERPMYIMTFMPPKTIPVSTSDFSLSTWFSSTGKTLTLKDNSTDFQLLDLRLTKK